MINIFNKKDKEDETIVIVKAYKANRKGGKYEQKLINVPKYCNIEAGDYVRLVKVKKL